MSRISVCFGCVPPKRYPGCHSVCEEYIKESERNAQDRDAKNFEQRIENTFGRRDHRLQSTRRK